MVALGGCATRDYQPAPIDPQTIGQAFESRRPDDPGLKQFLAARGLPVEPWPRPRWDLEGLSLLAIYFNDRIALARAEWQVARAAETTAAARANPGIMPVIEYHSGAGEFDSPWSLGLAFDLPWRPDSIRLARLDQAAAQSRAAALEIAAAAWRARARVRADLVDLMGAERALSLAESETAARRDIAEIERGRLALGEASALDVGAAESAERQAAREVESWRASLAGSRASLAESLGLPLAAVETLEITFAPLSDRALPALPARALQWAALLNHLALRGALEHYQAADAALRIELARQFPEITITPGLLWDQGDLVWTLGAALLLPVLDRNQGPIEQAEARRRLAARQVTATQAQLIGALDRTLAEYQASLGAADRARQTLADSQSRVAMIERQLAAGEIGRLAVLATRLDQMVAARDLWQAWVTAQRALGALEDIVQQPLDGSAPLAVDPGAPWPANQIAPEPS